MNHCTDLILGKGFCIFIFFHFPDSSPSVLNGLHFYFFIAWQCKPRIDQTTLILFHMYPRLIQQSPITTMWSVWYPWQNHVIPEGKLIAGNWSPFVEDISNSSLTDAKYAENVTDLTSMYDRTLLSILDQHASLNPLNPNTNSHLLSLYSSYRSSREKFLECQLNSSCMINPLILVTKLFCEA